MVSISTFESDPLNTVPCTPNLNRHASMNLSRYVGEQASVPMLTRLQRGHTQLRHRQKFRYYRNLTRKAGAPQWAPGMPNAGGPHRSQNRQQYTMLT